MEIFQKILQKIFGKFSLCFSSSVESKNYLNKLGAKNIVNIGNLKFSQSENDRIENQKSLNKFIRSKKVWCASSTHFNEEDLCGIVHKKLKQKYKNLLTIIIPRHINRTSSIKTSLNNQGFKVHLHETKSKIKKIQIYIW